MMHFSKPSRRNIKSLNNQATVNGKSHPKSTRANKLINPNLAPKTHIADQLAWSVRGRPVKNFMNLLKGETSPYKEGSKVINSPRNI